MAMAQKYLFIAISFYRNIVRENVSCELGLTSTFFRRNSFMQLFSTNSLCLFVVFGNRKYGKKV